MRLPLIALGGFDIGLLRVLSLSARLETNSAPLLETSEAAASYRVTGSRLFKYDRHFLLLSVLSGPARLLLAD